MIAIGVELVESFFDLISLVIEVVLRDPISALLVVVGNMLWLISFGAFGYLTIGAVLSWFSRLISLNIDQPSRREER